MSRVLVTGMSGAGKSTVIDELRRRGTFAVDTDYDGWRLSDGRRWDESRMGRLLARHQDVVVSGTVENQVYFYDRFEHIVLISAPLCVLMQRLRTRANNPYGKTSAEQAELFANQGATAVGQASLVRQLNEALESRKLLGQALGLISERYGVDENRAFGVLTRFSQTSNTKLRVVAADIVATANRSAGSDLS